MQSLPAVNKWVLNALFFAAGYALKLWLSPVEGISEDGDSPAHARRASRRHTPPPLEELKLVLVVNDALKMGKGKIGAQCAHAAVGITEELHGQGKQTLLAQWEECGQPKICLKAKDDKELLALARTAKASGLPAFIVQDAGRTQVAAGSRTVLAIGPAPRSAIDKVTGQLRLL